MSCAAREACARCRWLNQAQCCWVSNGSPEGMRQPAGVSSRAKTKPWQLRRWTGCCRRSDFLGRGRVLPREKVFCVCCPWAAHKQDAGGYEQTPGPWIRH